MSSSLKSVKHPATLFVHGNLSKNIVNPKYYQCRDLILKQANLNYTPQALQKVDIGFGGTGVGHVEFTKDGEQCYAQALAFLITYNPKYLENCLRILDAWATTCRTFTGPNAPLEAAWGTCAMARSLELLKYSCNPKLWRGDIEQRYIAWANNLILPHLRGDTERYRLNWGFFNNWHTSITEARLQLALLQNDIQEVNWCINNYIKIFNSYVLENGFTGETLRDSFHCIAGMGGLIQICELLFHQGVDLYGLRNNLLMRCVEFHARLYGTTYTPPGYQRDQFKISSYIEPCAWEIARNHFVNRRGLPMPYTDNLLKRLRPCGYVFHWGYDTLTHAIL
jgi:hypothetical protein